MAINRIYVFFDPASKRVVGTDPPGFMGLIVPVPETNLVWIPGAIYDPENNFNTVPVQLISVYEH